MKNDRHKVRPWRYEPEAVDQITEKQHEMMKPKNKPDMAGVYRR